jgi:urea transporter
VAAAVDAHPLRVAAEVLLRPYGQILLSRDLRAGLLVLAAIALFPMLALATLLAIAVSGAVALLFGLGLAGVREGTPTCTAVLTALAIGVFAPDGGHPLVLVAVGAVLATMLTASFEAVFASVTLPTHSFPFIASAWAVHLAARSLPADRSGLVLVEPWTALPAEWFASSWLDVPAALLFLHGWVAGALLLAAIFVHSRISLVLALIGWAVALAARSLLRPDEPWSAVDVVASFNAVLTAMALGGVWFVPQPSSMLLAAAGSAVAVVMSYALAPTASMAYLPVLSLPFVLTTHLVLMAARRRLEDRRPRSTIPADRPEEALARYLTRLRRFGDAAWLPFRLPFRGKWKVTQGHDGEHTHQGLWRHGLDFESVGRDGKVHEGEGASLRDYHCYGLPVVAAGAGTVAKIVDGIEDNTPGQINVDDRWGNAVILRHGPALCSVYAHLKPGTISVRQGEVVNAGSELARCGNSGRSPTPHLHFQIQRSDTLGSPTIPADFGDVVSETDDDVELANLVVPREGETVRPVMRDEAIARALAFLPGTVYELRDHDGREEVARVELDLLGRRTLKSTEATLFIEPYESGFVVVDFYGDPSSLLRFVLVGLARVPFDQARKLEYDDSLAARLLLPAWLRPLADLVAVVAPEAGATEVHYRAERQGGKLVVRGKSKKWTSKAVLSLGRGDHTIELQSGNRRETVTMTRQEPSDRGNGS